MGKPISPMKRKYLNGLVAGKSKRQAAIAAGYSESTASSAKAHIETPDVREEFAEIMRRKCPAEKIALRVAEGLNARTVITGADGQIISSEVLWGERRHYAKLAAEFGGYYVPPKQESSDNGTKVLIQFIRDTQTPTITVEKQPQVQEG